MSAKACVLGSPVSHSLSPKLHGHWLAKYGIDGSYTARETLAADLREALSDLVRRGFAGCNLTLPLKETALELMDALDESARAAGAVNTVVIRNGETRGYNSDGFGFIAGLDAQVPAWGKSHIVIIGAGGAARGIAAALKSEGVEKFSFICRTPARAVKIIRDLNLNGDVTKGLPGDASLLVNCTPLGLKGQPPLEIDISGLPKDAAVCDIVYRPLETPLLAAAKRHGLKTAAGLQMLLHQGRLGFRHWFGIDPAVTPALEKEIVSWAS
ncbi:MAG: shikimate dehydrogenase [Alphaproteobacteria bacterium]|nr:shikimate dehydrogenase [Alphaproteobacteria bacterium]MDE2337386.1 shikimate dehydrogenase [Alphaproteobacteria bacterium]